MIFFWLHGRCDRWWLRDGLNSVLMPHWLPFDARSCSKSSLKNVTTATSAQKILCMQLIRSSSTPVTFPPLLSRICPSTCSLTHLTTQSTLLLHTWAGKESDIFQQSFVSHQSLLVCVMRRKPWEPPGESSRSWGAGETEGGLTKERDRI